MMALGPEVQPPSAGVGVAKGWAGGLAEVARRGERGQNAVELDMRASGGGAARGSSSATFAGEEKPVIELVVPR